MHNGAIVSCERCDDAIRSPIFPRVHTTRFQLLYNQNQYCVWYTKTSSHFPNTTVGMLHTVAVRGAGAEGRRSAVVARYLSRSARGGAHSAALAQPGLRTCAAPALASATKRCPSQKCCGTRVAKGTACIGGARAGSHEICPRGGARAPRQQRRAAPHVRCCSAHPRIVVASALEEQFQRGSCVVS